MVGIKNKNDDSLMTKKISLLMIGLNEYEGINLLKERINHQKRFLTEILYIDGTQQTVHQNLLNQWDGELLFKVRIIGAH